MDQKVTWVSDIGKRLTKHIDVWCGRDYLGRALPGSETLIPPDQIHDGDRDSESMKGRPDIDNRTDTVNYYGKPMPEIQNYSRLDLPIVAMQYSNVQINVEFGPSSSSTLPTNEPEVARKAPHNRGTRRAAERQRRKEQKRREALKA